MKIISTKQTRWNERYITIQDDSYGAVTTYTVRELSYDGKQWFRG